MAKIDQRGDAIARVDHAAGHDGGEMRQLRLNIERDAVERHPALQPDANGRDLVLEAVTLVRPLHPDADAVLAPLAADVEGEEGADDPFLEACDIGADVRPSPL